jgi:hypothetical protein
MAMRFRNFGGIYQFQITNEEDLAKIDVLDPARWAATSAPLHDLHCDADFLKYIDAEGTGRVRVAQIVRARDWLFERLAKRNVVQGRKEAITLDAIRDEGEGAKLRAVATRVNAAQKAANAQSIALADVRAFKGGYAKLLANGDGVVPPGVIPEAEVADFVKDILATVGGVKDRGGDDGVDAAHLETFTKQAQAWLDWRAKEAAASVWGADSTAAADLVAKLDAKIEEHFLHCDLLRQEAPSEALLHLKEDEFRALRARDAAAIEAYVKASPLGPLNAAGTLDLRGELNALYRADMNDLAAKVVARALGESAHTLTRESWRKARGTFDGFNEWRRAKPAEPFDALGEAKVKGYLTGPLPARVTHFIDLDKAAAAEIDAVDGLEKLLLYVRWLIDLANNFVNFSAIYLPKETALIEMGSLIIDGRRLEFCVKVHDRAAHKPIASESMIYLVYANVIEKEGGAAAYEIVAPLTAGERGRLRAGKRGIFRDNDGKEWDAQITEVVENPVSIVEGMLAPFRRAAKFIGDKADAWFASKSEAQEQALMTSTESAADRATTAANTATTAPATPPATGAAPAPAANAEGGGGLNINTLILGGGVALAGVGALAASVFTALKSPEGWLAVLGVIGAVLAFSALNAWWKLRRRDVSVLLEANGWAINVRTRVTKRIAKVFAFTPDLPAEAVLERKDMLPAADDEGGGGLTFLVLLVIVAAVVAAYGHYRAHWF